MKGRLNSKELRELHEQRQRAQRANGRAGAKASRKLDRQRKAANTRAKYGPSGKPALVVVRSLETGEVLRVEGVKAPKQRTSRRRKGERLAEHRRMDEEAAERALRD